MGDQAAHRAGPRVIARVGIAAMLSLAVVTVGARTASAAAPLTVQTSVSPHSIYVADVVTARVDVFFDRGDVDPGSVQVTAGFGPWQQLRAVRTAAAHSSAGEHRTWWFTVACFSIGCLPNPNAVRKLSFPLLTVSARTTKGAKVSVRAPWPSVNVAARFPEPNLHALVTLGTDTQPPPPSFRIRPSLLVAVLRVLGIVLVILALAAAGLEVVRRRARRGAGETTSPLLRTLAIVRGAQRDPVDDRRRAVGLLARVLVGEPAAAGTTLASAASEVAWSGAEPTPDELEEIARKVEAGL